MSVPIYWTDGDYTVAEQIAEWEIEFPFVERGDNISFVARRPMRIESSAMRRPVINQRRTFDGLGYAYFCGQQPARRVDGFSQLVDYDEVWASVPATNNKTYQSVSYTEQFLQISPEVGIVELSKSKRGQVLWEYAIGPLPQLIAPRLVQLGSVVFSQGGWRPMNPGQTVLSDDSENGIYMGQIYYRKSVYVTYSGFTDLGV